MFADLGLGRHSRLIESTVPPCNPKLTTSLGQAVAVSSHLWIIHMIQLRRMASFAQNFSSLAFTYIERVESEWCIDDPYFKCMLSILTDMNSTFTSKKLSVLSHSFFTLSTFLITWSQALTASDGTVHFHQIEPFV